MHVGGFRVSFTPLTGVLFTVPSQYSSAIGRCRYLALESGLPSFRRPSTGAAVLACHVTGSLHPAGTGFSPSLTALSSRLPLKLGPSGVPVGTPAWSHNPATASATAHMHGSGLGSSPFARHYLGSLCLLLGVLRCFSSPGSLHLAYRFSQGCQPHGLAGYPIRVPPDQCLLTGSPELFVVRHALLRPATPRHPPPTSVRLRLSRRVSCIFFAQLRNHSIGRPIVLPAGPDPEGPSLPQGRRTHRT